MWGIDRSWRAFLGVGALLGAGELGAQPGVLPPPPPAAHAPRIAALPKPAVAGTLDLAELARGFAADAGGSLPVNDGARLLVFVSLAMPEATLDRLVEQARRAQATLVLRGMAEGSLTKTAERVRTLLGDKPVQVQIDPRLFDRFAVQRVPTFVLERGSTDGAPCQDRQCASGAKHVSVSGDVSLDYALRHLRDRAPQFARDATRLLKLLER